MLHYILDNKKKNVIFPFGELITKILLYTDFDLEAEELEIIHSKIEKGILSKMGYTIQGRETVALPLRRGRQKRNNDPPPSSSHILNGIPDDKREIHSKIEKLIKKMEKLNLISLMVSSKDGVEMN